MTRRFFVLATAALVSGCAGAGAQADDVYSPKLRVAWEEFKKLYDAKNVVVIDVRDPGSYQNGHIPGARSMPLDSVEKRLAELKKEKRPVVTYCA